MTINDLIFRLVRPVGGLQVAKYLARRHPRILMYHRIAPSSEGGAIGLEQFRQQMQTIKRELNPVSLDALISANCRNAVPENAVAITFDDGYADFYKYAFPVIKQEGLPCTLFVTTGFVSGELWLWPDRLRFCVDQTTQEQVSFPEINQSFSISDGRHTVWNRLADYCLTLANDDKGAFIERVAHELNVAMPVSAPSQYQGLTWDQVREINRAGVEIGSHSVSHPILTSLDQKGLRSELENSRKTIERETGQRVRGFCYPNGQPIDFDERVKNAVREAGYEYALAAFPGRKPLKDLMAIHRYPGSTSNSMFEKTVFGFSYLRLGNYVS